MDAADLSFELTEDDLAEARVVLVDDDDLVTGSLRNLLLLQMDIDAVVFNDPAAAREYLARNEIDLIVSDFLMPEVNGIELLAAARELQPEAPRILLTGYADKENAIRALNQVRLFQYLEKPWENEQFQRVIRNGLERRHLIRTLSRYVETLVTTEDELARIRRGLVRAFA